MTIVNRMTTMINNSLSHVPSTDVGLTYLMKFLGTVDSEMSDEPVLEQWVNYRRNNSTSTVYWADMAVYHVIKNEADADLLEKFHVFIR